MAQTNLLGWANSIRLNMASDSGREFFQQQVQTQGFLFLDDYLDNILSGTKQDPLIELVKTPGRRKIVAKKPKTASKLGNPIFFSLSSTIDENKPPLGSHPTSTPNALEAEPTKSIPSPTEHQPSEQRPVLGDTHPLANATSDKHDLEPESEMEDIASALEQLGPPPVDQANLSVIVEDEEPAERSRVSIAPPVKRSPKLSSNKRPSPDAAPERNEEGLTAEPPAKVARTMSPRKEEPAPMDVQEVQFHPKSPSEYHSAQATPRSPTFASTTKPKVEEDPPMETEPPKEEPKTESAPERSSFQKQQFMDTEFTTRFSDTVDMQVPLRDADATNRTTSIAIPSLPEPMPLRKSMRVPRDPSVGAVLTGAATPGGPAGKRTSWLMKAREVKALDKSTKVSTASSHPPPVLSGALGQAQGFKRKSGDVETATTPAADQEHKSKVPKHADGDNPSSKVESIKKASPPPPREPTPEPVVDHEALTFEPQNTSGVFGLLKKTMEGLVGKPASKTGSDAFSALAEAKAAAEARIKARDQKDETMAPISVDTVPSEHKMQVDPAPMSRPPPMDITDLFPADSRLKDKGKAPEKPFQFFPMPVKKQDLSSHRESTSTTPPHSPPLPPASTSFVGTGVPLFNKITPVFIPPTASSRPLPSPPTKHYNFQPPESVFTSVHSSLQSPKGKGPAQSTMESGEPDRAFDDDDDDFDDVPAWVPPTQNADYTEGYGDTRSTKPGDDDDTWHDDVKEELFVFRGESENTNSTGWSALQKSRNDTGVQDKTTSSLRNPVETTQDHTRESQQERHVPGAFSFEPEPVTQEKKPEEAMEDEKEPEEPVVGGIRLVPQDKSKSFRPQSQMSMASSSSQETQPQSQGGLLSQASKLFNSALGAGKKKQPEVKKIVSKPTPVIKKQQEEADRKAARMKEAEIKRQQAQKKAEEEKAKQAEEVRKAKEEMERRKREREAQEKQRSVKPTPVKKPEETQKIGPPEKKNELKKTTSIPNLAKSQLKPTVKPAILAKTATFGGTSQAASSSKVGEQSKVPKFAPSSSLNKGKAKAPAMTEDELGQPSQFLQEQMAARAKAQIQAAKQTEPVVPSESIELPDINSEYSDSDDEDRKRTYDPPDWAQSPELKEALKLQSTINPDDIFGAVRPLKMEEIFKTRTSRFRARTSSANWTGTDRLTVAEEREYAERMGFK